MSSYTINRKTANKFLSFLLSIVYGFFIIFSIQRLYLLGSGDINAYLNFFENIDLYTTFNEYSIRGDGVFRLGVVFLSDFFNAETITVLSYLAFTISTTVFWIYSANIRSSKYLVYILPLFLMVFLTPMVSNLFASSIRSGIAFTVLLIAFVYCKSFIKYILFILSSLIHLSMVPIISLYILFNILKNMRIKSPFIIPFFLLLAFSFFITLASNIFQFNTTAVTSSFFFNFLIFYVGLLVIFINKKAIKNIYGFISVALFLIFIWGVFFDLSFMRYVGFAIILYLFFLIERGETGTIQVFTIGYIPFFALTVFYTIANTL
tara:strand:- start:7597 stop:8556 length:960 start_codon:yes stop_codon:yes gene_type:complete